MSRRVFPIVLTLALAACGGGGGSTVAAGVVPAAQSPSSAGAPAGVLPAATGTIAAGYIECDTAANTAAGNNCNGYANFSNGAFAFTAIAATASGAPIAQQLAGAGALGFANGSYRVVESPADGAAMIAISGGPWATPGAVMSDAAGAFGQRFFVTCLLRGTAHLQLQLVSFAGIATPLPLAAGSFAANETAVNCSASGSVSLS